MNLLFVSTILGQAAPPPDQMISGSYITSFVVAVIGALGVVWAKRSGRDEGKREERASQDRTITNNPLETKEVPDWATREDIDELRGEIKDLAAKVERNFETERETARVALGNAHRRIDAESKVAATLMGQVEGIGKNVELLLRLATNKAKS